MHKYKIDPAKTSYYYCTCTVIEWLCIFKEEKYFKVIIDSLNYSIKWEGKNNLILINDPRFSPAGVLAPPSKVDLAFTMHMLSWLSTIGTAAIVEFPGVLYRGGAEQKIRKYLIDNNYIDAIIQLCRAERYP